MSWEMQNHRFSVDLRVLKIVECQMVLVVDWLKYFSPFTFDFKSLTLQLNHKGETILLQGVTNSALLKVIGAELLGNMSNLEDAWMAQLSSMQVAPIGDPMKLIRYNGDLFQELTNLPPKWTHDHKIFLKPDSQPVNLRPYQYPNHHKTELKNQVKEMLDLGIIRHSQRPYASPALLVGKRDDTLQMCIDYKKLNSMTIIDKFIIPIIDDLLYELYGASIFTKLDLRSGYHQIQRQHGRISLWISLKVFLS